MINFQKNKINIPIKNQLFLYLLKIGQPQVYKFYKQYSETQWWPRKEIEGLQFKRVKEMLVYAYNNFSFYYDKFKKNGLKPTNFKNLSDINKYPLTRVAELKQAYKNGDFHQGYNQEKISILETTGSTGTPFIFPINQSALDERLGCNLRNIEWYGHYLGNKNARLWRTSKSKNLINKIKQNLFGRRLELSIYDVDDSKNNLIDDTKLQYFCNQLIKKRIEILDGYVSALILLADYVNRKKIKGLNFKSIVCGAEYLSPEARKLIESTFKCRVYNRYGGTELSCIAHQSTNAVKEELLIMSDKLLLEVIKNGKPVAPGKLGEIVVTDFTNRAMPFIRLQVGDVAIAENPSKISACGRGLHLLRSVEGRINDLFLLPGGKILSTHIWHKIFRSQDYVKQFKVIQEKKDLIVIQVVLEENDERFELLKIRVDKLLTNCRVVWRILLKIPSGKGGKYRHSVSKIPIKLNQIRKVNY
jgi:phenylacetate-CoA ligase